jgi:hypothetical protein
MTARAQDDTVEAADTNKVPCEDLLAQGLCPECESESLVTEEGADVFTSTVERYAGQTVTCDRCDSEWRIPDLNQEG